MKKVVIIFVLFVLLGSAYILFVNNKVNNTSLTGTVDNIHGFSFTPPEGWVLWEGVSAMMDPENGGVPTDKDNPDLYDPVEFQKYVNSWKPELSKHLVYTRSDVDVETRNIKRLEQYSLEKIENPLAHDTVFISIMEGEINYELVEKETERSETKYKETDWGRILYKRVKLTGYDIVSVAIPLGNNMRLLGSKNVDPSEDDMLSFFENFFKDLKINKNTAK